MPRQIIDDSLWEQQIYDANAYYNKWANLFKCNKLEEYYEGKQWQDAEDDAYTINKFYETVQIKCDAYCPVTPRFILNPRAGNSDFDLDTAVFSTQLKQDTLNSLIADDREVFVEETKESYKNSFFRFGVIEIGYDADWVMNPNANRPFLNVDTQKDTYGKKPKRIGPPAELPVTERVYIKHIDAKTFRVGGQDHRYLHRCDWYGYYEFVRREDLLSMDGLMNRDLLQSAGTSRTQNYSKPTDPDASTPKFEPISKDQDLKIWHIWHNKAKVRLIVVDSPCITIFQRTFKRQTVFDYRPDLRTVKDGFYPVPPSFHWVSSQNELNETRQQMRAHRRKFNQQYQVIGEYIDDEELEKFEEGVDGALIRVKRENAISAIAAPGLGPAADKMIALSAQDINEISGTSANDRGIADRTTATESQIINQRSQLRENAEQKRVSKFLCRIGREILLICRDKFVLGVWAERNGDTSESIFQEVQANQTSYTWVTSEDLNDGYDFRIEVDLTSISIVAQEAEKKKFFEFTAFISQYPAVAMSPILIRQAAYSIGFRNERVIKEMQKMALLQQLGQMAGIQQAQGNLGQQQMAKSTPNQQEQTRQQLRAQVQ